MIVVGIDESVVVMQTSDGALTMTTKLAPWRAKELAEQLVLAADQLIKRPHPDPSQ